VDRTLDADRASDALRLTGSTKQEAGANRPGPETAARERLLSGSRQLLFRDGYAQYMAATRMKDRGRDAYEHLWKRIGPGLGHLYVEEGRHCSCGRTLDDWDRTIDVNIKGVLYGIAAALPHMKRQKAGHIINVSSVAGHKVGPAGAVYSATKHAVRALSEGLRQEVKAYNLRTTVISPGAVATELPNSITDARRLRQHPQVLRGIRNPCGLVRAGRGVRDQPAGGRGHQRDPVPADAPGTLTEKGELRT
jgi:NAD(P)-dependent dehydrogenase (short-subunit alcohol dehydrogenase family)